MYIMAGHGEGRSATEPWSSKSSPALGVWVKIPVPEVLEVLAGSGVHFVVLDCEHGSFDQRTMSTMVGFARGLGLKVFVRVLGHSPSDVQPPLDAGADGLFVPHVDDVEIARQLVRACRFPPLGTRPGSPMTRAGDWGRSTMTEYVSRGNTKVSIVAQIESPTAVKAAKAIGGVSGLDAIFVGPFDLGLSSGLSPDEPEFQRMVESVEGLRGTIALGGVATGPAETAELGRRGYSFVMVGADTSLLLGAVSSLCAQIKEITVSQVEGTT
jgi:4-hydroxy-2-oxoheptanedioate aldolase